MIQITSGEHGGCRGYESKEERDKDIRSLRSKGYDHFVCYKDTQAPIALSYGKSLQPSSERKDNIAKPWCPRPGNTGYDLLC